MGRFFQVIFLLGMAAFSATVCVVGIWAIMKLFIIPAVKAIF